MGIKAPYICEIAPDTYAINEFGLAAVYLLVGQEKALLIDTGCGVCDLKSVVSGLTDKPYSVAITHGHFDHVGGMGCFEAVYLSEKDRAMAESIKAEEVRGYADMFGKAGGYSMFDYVPEDIEEIAKFPQFLPLNEGDRFDLGGRIVETFSIPGHTAGGIAFLDESVRILFSGDCCNTNLLTPDCAVSATLGALRKCKSLSARFDRNFNGHVGYMGNPECRSQPKELVDDLIHICECILRNESTPEPFDFFGHKFTRMSYRSAKLSYNPNYLEEEEDENGQQS